jgi:osmotically-inducible protein OsmY
MSGPDKSSDNRDHTADSRNPDWEKYVADGKGRTDEQIRADVHAAISAGGGGGAQTLSVSVQDGVVTLEGKLAGDAAQQQVLEKVRSVPSVREVLNQLQS